MFIPCFKSFKQEPYVVVKQSSHLPLFDERFINYGKDKISWIENLRYDGYAFAVLRNAFAVDIPHPRYCLIILCYIDQIMQRSFLMLFKVKELKNGI